MGHCAISSAAGAYVRSLSDETLSGHPLAGRGLRTYAIHEVLSSSWVRQLETMNSVHLRHNTKMYDDLKHYVFAFHDSTFEWITRGFDRTIVTVRGVMI